MHTKKKAAAIILYTLTGQSWKKRTNGALLRISQIDGTSSLSHKNSSMGRSIYPLSYRLVFTGSKFSPDRFCFKYYCKKEERPLKIYDVLKVNRNFKHGGNLLSLYIMAGHSGLRE